MATEPAQRRRQIGETVVALAFLAIAALVFQQTRTSLVEQGAAGGDAMFNAAMFPELLAWSLVIVSALQLVAIFRPGAGGPEPAEPAADPQTPAEHRDSRQKALLCLAYFVLYVALLRPLGYHLTTPIFMLACFYTLGTRNIPVAVLLAVACSLAMSFVFEYWMGVILPVGRFGIGF